MGNSNLSKIFDEQYNDIYTSVDGKMINEIRKNYKIIDIDWLDSTLVNSKMCADEYFEKSLDKK